MVEKLGTPRRRAAAIAAVAVVFGGISAAPHALQSGRPPALDFEFFRAQVEPIFLRERGGFVPGSAPCVTCHVKSATPLPLRPPHEADDGTVYWTEEQSRENYAAAARLVVPGQPEASRLLRKPLAVEAGGAQSHVGGKYWDSTEDAEWQVLAAWVRTADAEDAAPVESVQPPDFAFFRACVQPIFLDKRPGQMECFHCHTGGVRGFARPIPEGRSSWNEEESRQNFGVLMRFIEPGYPIYSRFLMHPLHPNAGGDHFHGGPRRWESMEDPEWQMLAAWIRGERQGDDCR